MAKDAACRGKFSRSAVDFGNIVSFLRNDPNRTDRSLGGRLIINADDFGLSSEVNEGILEAFEKGILTSASLVPTGEAFLEAVRMIKDVPSLDMGIHLTLVGEKSVLDKRDIPTLVDEEGKFRKNAYRFVIDYFMDRISMEDVSKELSAQFEKVVFHGVSISHVDSHQHIHMLPKILDITILLAKQYGIHFIRFPREKIRIPHLFSWRKYPRLVQQFLLNMFCFYSTEQLKPYATDCFYGFFHGGNLGINELKVILMDFGNDGTGEIMCHPAKMKGGKIPERYRLWDYHWSNEFDALVDQNINNLVREKNITLSSFRDMKKTSGNKA